MKYWLERKRTTDESYKERNFNSSSSDRAQFSRDRARVIHSAAFRRLQSKTQVLGLGESDFYRTRLTHSLEVAQIGSAICDSLREKCSTNESILKWIPTRSLIEAICLSHDIGHPPFGHGGEVALNYSMRRYGGFEGNGQTLRIISKLGEFSPNHGLDLTRRAILGVIKYPCEYSKVENYAIENEKETSSLNLDSYHPPKCFFDDEVPVLEWVFKEMPEDYNTFKELTINKNKHHKPRYKSLDCSIMELADDISYAIHDLEDALALELVTYELWAVEVLESLKKYSKNTLVKNMRIYSKDLFSGDRRKRKHAISKIINYFITNVNINTQGNTFSIPLLNYSATLSNEDESILNIIKSFFVKNVIKKPEVQILEYKGQQMVLKLFSAFNENPTRLLPKTTLLQYEKNTNRERVICDFISGMTDTYATKQYHKLFTPNSGSVFDKI